MRVSVLLLIAGLVGSQALKADPVRNIELLAASCAACHGAEGHSDNDIPSLAGVDEDKFKRQIGRFISGERQATVMHQLSLGYTPDEIELLATFFQQQ
jgi:cytochrome c553